MVGRFDEEVRVRSIKDEGFSPPPSPSSAATFSFSAFRLPGMAATPAPNSASALVSLSSLLSVTPEAEGRDI